MTRVSDPFAAKPPVRVLLCTSGGLQGARVMRRLAADERVLLVGVVQSTRVFGRTDGLLKGAFRLLRASGLAYLTYLWASTGLADLLGRYSVKRQAACLGCQIHHTRDINDAHSQGYIAQCAPELLVSAFFNQRIDLSVFAGMAAGAVNIHPSLLPALRGVDPVFFGRLRGQFPLGVSLHRIAAELDTGQVIAQASVELPPDSSVLAATGLLFERGAELLLDHLDGIVAGDAGSPQVGSGNYDSWPAVEQVAALKRRGVSLWRWRDLLAS